MTKRPGELAERAWRKLCLEAHDRDGWACHWCSRRVHRLINCPARRGQRGCKRCAVGDHRIGLIQGQAAGHTPAELNQLANIVTACADCNNQRSHRQRLGTCNTHTQPREHRSQPAARRMTNVAAR